MTTIHLAGPLDPQTLTQRCVRCGSVLAEPYTVTTDRDFWDERGHVTWLPVEEVHAPRRVYPQQALVGVSPQAVWIELGAAAVPTCQAVQQQKGPA